MDNELKKLYDIQSALNSTTIVAITDTAGRIIFANSKFCEISKYSLDELIGKTHRIVNSNYHDPSFFRNLWTTISQGKTWKGEIQNKAKDGSLYWVETYIIPFLDENGEPYQYVSIRHDITERKLLEKELHKQLIEDKVTGLPNGYSFKNEVLKKMDNDEQFYLLLINLDNFKSFNEGLGIYYADQILKAVGQRLTQLHSDDVILARIYSDEFAIIFNPQHRTIHELLAEIFELFEQPITHRDIDHYITLSIGVAEYPTHAQSHEQLMQHAVRAMNVSKSRGKNTYTFFDINMENNEKRMFQMKNLLRKAIQEKEFTLHYQPQFNAKNEIVSFEALARWENPILGNVPPSEFIEVAEKSGLILPLGYLLFELMLIDLPRLQKAVGRPIKVAFNLSLKQFIDIKLTEKLIELCKRYKVDPQFIKIEITEGVAAHKIHNVQSVINALRNVGMEIELDDFGTGFSSLQYLKNLSINCIKIDRSFINDMLVDQSSLAIVNSIIHLAHQLGFSVIAEGIETEEQMDYLRNRGCDGFQGYLLGKPQCISFYEKENKLHEVF